MPSCAISSVAPGTPLSPTRASKGRVGFPPELLSAVELLFFAFSRNNQGISAELFFAEAFAAAQRRDFGPSKLVQNFLHALLGSTAYAGPTALSTYYGVVVGALAFAGTLRGSVTDAWPRCRWVLQHWGVSRETRDVLELPTRHFTRRVIAEGTDALAGGTALPNPSVAACEQWIAVFRQRMKKFGPRIDNLGRQ